jgi:Mn2+/Fe2+ NRAMP family transporter
MVMKDQFKNIVVENVIVTTNVVGGEQVREFANSLWIKVLGWTVATIIIVLNVKLLFDTFMPEAARRAFYGFLGLPAE